MRYIRIFRGLAPRKPDPPFQAGRKTGRGQSWRKERQIGRQKDRQRAKLEEREADRQAERQAEGKVGGKTGR